MSTTRPTFSWQGVTGASRYGLYVSRYPYGTANIIYQQTSLTGSSHTPPSGVFVEGERYRWQMTSFNSSGTESSTSGLLYFQVASASVGPPTPLDPGTSSEPGETVSTTRPTFSWQGVTGASRYGLYVSRYPYGTANIIYQQTSLTGSSHTPPSGVFVEGERYRWQMTSFNGSGTESSTSGLLYFQVASASVGPPSPLDPGTSSEPGETVSTTRPTFSWQGVTGASRYGLYVSRYPYGTANIIYQQTSLTGSSHTPPSGVFVEGERYRWQMTSFNSSGTESSTSGLLYFQVASASVGPPTPLDPGTSSEPGETVSTTRPTFSWQGVTGASRYGLYVSRYPYGTANIIYQQTSLTGSSHTPPSGVFVEGERYRWQMTSFNSSGTESSTSGLLYFQVASASVGPPSPLDPGTSSEPGETVSTTRPTFSWQGVTGASRYGLYVSRYPYGTANIIYQQTSLTGSSHTPPSGVFVEGERYRWQMTSFNSSGTESSTSGFLYFQVAGGGSKPATPTNLSPGSTSSPGPILTNSTVTLNWSESNDATSYDVGVRDLSTDELVVDEQTSLTSHVATLSPGRPYRWNVSACNSAGCSAITAHYFFQTASDGQQLPAPNLLSPPDDSSGVPVSPTLAWSHVPGAHRYWLTIATSDSLLPTDPGARSCSGCVISCTVAETTHVAGTSCLTGATRALNRGKDYYWRVQPLDFTGNGGLYSPIHHFATGGDAPPPKFNITGVTIYQPRYPTEKLEEVPPGGGVSDGNILTIDVAVENLGDAGETSVLLLDIATRELPGVNPVATIELPAFGRGAVRYLWDTSGASWAGTDGLNRGNWIVRAALGGDSATAQVKVLPRPMFLVHGLWSDADTWESYPAFAAAAHSDYRERVFAVEGIDTADCPAPIEDNAEALAEAIENKRKELNAWHFDLIGHSLGGLISRYYVHNKMPTPGDGRAPLKNMLTIGTPHLGTECASIKMCLWGQLGPPAVTNFNASVSDFRGAHFAAAAGHQILTLCPRTPLLSRFAGDMVVMRDSALWTAADRELFVVNHTLMTESEKIFREFVLPRVSSIASGEVQAIAPATASVEYQPGFNVLNMSSHALAPGKMQDVAVEVPAAELFGVLVQSSSEKVVLGIQAPGGIVSELDGQPPLLSFQRNAPTAGRWKVTLRNSSASNETVDVMAWVEGSQVRLLLSEVQAGQAGEVRIEAQLERASEPVLGSTIRAEILRDEAVVRTFQLFDNGQGDDHTANDGLYAGGGQAGPLPDGNYEVFVEAQGLGYTIGAVSVLKIEGDKRHNCAAGETVLCSHNSRFQASVTWRDHLGNVGDGLGWPLSGETGYFTFFDRDNPELFVKVLDACPIGQGYWVFSTALSNVEYELLVEDALTGQQYRVRNPSGHQAPAILNTASLFTACDGNSQGVTTEVEVVTTERFIDSSRATVSWRNEAPRISRCRQTRNAACVQGERFKIEASYRDFSGAGGAAKMHKLTADSSYATFFDEGNVELFVKVLNACSFAGQYWVFASGMTNVEVRLEVTDTQTGKVMRIENPATSYFPTYLGTSTEFTNCP